MVKLCRGEFAVCQRTGFVAGRVTWACGRGEGEGIRWESDHRFHSYKVGGVGGGETEHLHAVVVVNEWRGASNAEIVHVLGRW